MANPLTISKSNSNGGKANSDSQRRNELEAQLSPSGDRSSDIHSNGGEGRFSIDYSLELERELAMESPPQTPMRATAATSPALDRQLSQSARSALSDAHSVESTPDPEVLAHIITQLRHSLADMTKEKEELVKLLGTANTEEANAKDALQVMTDKATEAEEALAELKKKAREDEDQITMLRAKVEESRYGAQLLVI
jgi:chromosome segregation ATPase